MRLMRLLTFDQSGQEILSITLEAPQNDSSQQNPAILLKQIF